MKRSLLFSWSFLGGLFLPINCQNHQLIGHWISRGQDHSTVHLDFTKDGSFQVSVQNKLENEGHYKFYNDTFCIYDANCGTHTEGKYKIIFFNDDSAAFKVINDPCIDRSHEIDGGIIKRIKD